MDITVKCGNVEIKVEGISVPYRSGMEPHHVSQLKDLLTQTIEVTVKKACELAMPKEPTTPHQ